jgi:hypothetical protein
MDITDAKSRDIDMSASSSTWLPCGQAHHLPPLWRMQRWGERSTSLMPPPRIHSGYARMLHSGDESTALPSRLGLEGAGSVLRFSQRARHRQEPRLNPREGTKRAGGSLPKSGRRGRALRISGQPCKPPSGAGLLPRAHQLRVDVGTGEGDTWPTGRPGTVLHVPGPAWHTKARKLTGGAVPAHVPRPQAREGHRRRLGRGGGLGWGVGRRKRKVRKVWLCFFYWIHSAPATCYSQSKVGQHVSDGKHIRFGRSQQKTTSDDLGPGYI